MNRNSSNLTWQEDFFSPIKVIFHRYLTIGQSCQFTINITKFDSMDYIDRIVIYEKSNPILYKILNVNDKIPISLNDDISFQSRFLSIKPTVRVEGRYSNISTYFELDAIRPIIMTSYHPIYDVRLARSNLIEDNWKINPLIQFLNKYGFDCSTLGIEVHGTQNPNDQSFLKCEKEWASQGDCFIAILTERYNTLTKKLPPGWVHAEDGLSYAEGRPRFVFVEKGVTRDGSYRLVDYDHVIEFDPNNIEGIYFQAEKIVKLRKECQQNQLMNNIKNLGIIGMFTLTLYGGLSLLDALSNKNRKRITSKKAFKYNRKKVSKSS